MTIPSITAIRLGGSPGLPLLLLGPSLGTSAQALWSRCAAELTDRFEILAWDLPGHGSNTNSNEPFTMVELAAGVLEMIDDMAAERGQAGPTFAYAGDSVGGAVGLQLLLDAPHRVESAVLISTGAKIGEAAGWTERAAAVRTSGTRSVVEGSANRWFGPGFLDREPEVGAELLLSLQDASDNGYAHVCEALARFDVRDQLASIRTRVLAVAGSEDVATPPASLEAIAAGVSHGHLVVLDGISHLPPAEAPSQVASLIRLHADGEDPFVEPETLEALRAAGMAVRRDVLGDAHVDRATASATDLTSDFQDFITQYAWGSVWTRPGLDRRTRSFITLTALVARGHHDELAMHVRAALTNGVSREEIKELLLQTAIYCGVPDANTAYRITQRVLDEVDEEKR